MADDDRDWAAYYRHTAGREARPLFTTGMQLATEAGRTPGQAVEIGFGDGTETLALLETGWRVLAIDSAPQARDVLLPRVSADLAAHLDVRIAPAQDVEIPPFDLLYSGYALSFLSTADFRCVWTNVRASLRPGGIVIVNVFGVRDTWAGDEYMTFVDRETVGKMVAGLEVLELNEEDADGSSFCGEKHWHVFDIVARRPLA